MVNNICFCGGVYEYRNGKWMCNCCDAIRPEEITNEEATLLYVATQERQLKNFDEAERKYSDIIERYPKNAESYFGRVLSKYGIIYEKDYDGRNIPTCCATSLESFLDDKDYLKALELADKENKKLYQEHAEYIEKIRVEWIEKAQKEEPYDIFISYKETEGLRRTEDSIAVQDLYIHLTEQGYRVFFSRESLRDKTGQNYEPYIFNALSTAKVMLVYASRPEYVMSTWLKNEWTRYIKRIKLGEKRGDSLLVACDGFSPNELPSVLAKKQCLDAKARSFYTDLDNRIKELVKNPKVERGSIRKYKVEKINVEELVPAKKQEIKQFDALHEHNFKKVQVVPPTCNSQGYTLFRCDCGEEKKTDFTPKRTSHAWQLAERKEPTCINNGYELYECKYCDATDKKILTATGHDEFVAEEKEATCFEEGYRKYECKICGHTRFEPISKTNHEYGDWVITKHPTCVENGEETRQCKNCSNQQKRELLAKGHSFSEWVVKTEPTCEKEGVEHRQCKTCGKIEERSLPKRKHKFGAWQDSKDGMHKERLCEYCGKVDKVLTEEYIRQHNKRKARVLEIIAYGLFVIAFAVMFTDFNIVYALCSILGLATLSLSLKLEYKKRLVLFSVAYIVLNVIFTLNKNLQEVKTIAIITTIISILAIFLIYMMGKRELENNNYLLLTLITTIIFLCVYFLEIIIFIVVGLNIVEISSQIIVGTGLCVLAIYGYIFYCRAELVAPINAIFYSVILLVLALLPPSIIVFCLAAASIVGGIRLSIYTYHETEVWEYGIVVTETVVMGIVFFAKLALTIVNL